MTGTIRIVVIVVLSLIASLELPRTLDALASNGGVLYLRAQYKLVTGDADSARRLMQQAVQANRQNGLPSSSSLPAHPTNACTRTAEMPVASL